MAFSLWPAAVRVFYHSPDSPHSMTIPTRAWFAPSEGHLQGTFTNWEDTLIDADDMVQAFVTALEPSFPSSNAFDSYIIYAGNPAVLDTPLLPRVGNLLTQTGSSGTPGWSKAVQGTLSIRTEDFNLFKVVLLDCATGDSFEKITDLVPDDPLDVIVQEVTDTAKAWSGRDGSIPTTFLQFALTLNEKLRRSYKEN